VAAACPAYRTYVNVEWSGEVSRHVAIMLGQVGRTHTHLNSAQGLASPFAIQLGLSDVRPTGSVPQTLPEIVGAGKGGERTFD
jgi:hypothetical protein